MRATLTARQFAYLAIRGPGTLEQVSEVLRLQPSEGWNAGDINTRNGRPYPGMCWQWRSGLDDTHPLENHIQAILAVIETRAKACQILWPDHDLVLRCVG